jgi:hypothetical protein
MNNYVHSPQECPEHKGEYLVLRNLDVITPEHPQGMIIPCFEYCEKADKYLNDGKLVSKEKAALEYANQIRSENKKYTIDQIKVVETSKGLEKKV